jgi:crossover junction endodeoxyribonuclease RuvC
MKKSSPHSTAERRRVVLGVDPGTLVTGYGVVCRTGSVLHAPVYGTIRNSPESGLAERLCAIHEELARLIQTHRPDAVSVESAFTGKNAQSALKLGHARGVAVLAAAQAGLLPEGVAPREAKLAVTGRGNATKEQVRYMVASLLNLTPRSLPLDASDALAIALTLLLRRGGPRPRAGDWAAFVKAHPERVRT